MSRILLREPFAAPVSCRVQHYFSSGSFHVPGFTLRPSIPLELILMQGDRYGFSIFVNNVRDFFFIGITLNL